MDTSFPRIMHVATATVFLLAAAAIPASYFLRAHDRLVMGLEAALAYSRYQLEQLINHNPDFWMYEIHRLEGTLMNARSQSEPQSWRIIDAEGRQLLNLPPASGTELPLPVISRKVIVQSANKPAAFIEASTTAAPELLTALLLTLGSFSLGALAYFGVRRAPLRALEEMWRRNAFAAGHDNLTGLPNRSLFHERLDQALARVAASGLHAAVLSIDLDHFKDVNDTLGHAAGDQLLRLVVTDILSVTSEDQLLARLGGDEFALIHNGADIVSEAMFTAEAIIAKLSHPYEIDGNKVHIGASIGIATTEGMSDISADRLLERSDMALYQAKQDGRNDFRFFQEAMNYKICERRLIETELRKAIDEHALQLHFQPQIDMKTRAVVGAEALLRWRHPEMGVISPSKFIPVAEQSRLIRPLGAWVLEEACREAALWPKGLIAVNVSPVQFRSDDIVDTVRSALDRSGLDPRRLEIEITEGILLHDTERTLESLGQLKALGIGIVMDDFGTGYSSLGYIHRFPFDKIKIDRSFIAQLDRPGLSAGAIVRAIISLSASMGITVIAEGVETERQAEILLAEGCEEAQGYLFSRPMSASEVRSMFGARATNVISLPQTLKRAG